MQDSRVKVLWLSMYTPISTAFSGGSQTFNYYFKQFMADPRFEIKLISCGFYKEKETIDTELAGIDYHISYWGNPRQSKLTKLINIESKYNLWNRYGGLLSNVDRIEIINQMKHYKEAGYSPNVIIMEWTSMVMLAKDAKKIFPEAKLIASEHDVTFIGYQRRLAYYTGLKKTVWKQKYKTEKRAELRNLGICDLILPHNSDNKQVLCAEGLANNNITGLVPYFNNMTCVERKSNHRDVLFFGAMSRPENSLSAVWFINEVMPRIKDLDIRFVILGSNPPDELKQLASDRVHITGFVKSVEPYFAQSMCLVSPLVLGAGIKIKVLEALSSGIPVLTNTIGIEGIPAEKNKDYFFCETPEEYEKMIRTIYNGKVDETAIEKQAKSFINKNFSIHNFSAQYRNMVYEMSFEE